MARIDVVMPQMGESIAEGTLSRWLKKAGDPVKRDEPIFEISTDKVDAEIPAPGAGILAEILVQEGETVAVQTVVGRIETEAGAAAAPAAASPPPKAAAAAPVAPAAAVPSFTTAFPLVTGLSNTKTIVCAGPIRGSVVGVVGVNERGRSNVPAAPCALRESAPVRLGVACASAATGCNNANARRSVDRVAQQRDTGLPDA